MQIPVFGIGDVEKDDAAEIELRHQSPATHQQGQRGAD